MDLLKEKPRSTTIRRFLVGGGLVLLLLLVLYFCSSAFGLTCEGEYAGRDRKTKAWSVGANVWANVTFSNTGFHLWAKYTLKDQASSTTLKNTEVNNSFTVSHCLILKVVLVVTLVRFGWTSAFSK